MIDGFPVMNVRADTTTGIYRFSAPGFDDGEHRVRVRPTDAAGNAGFLGARRLVTVDTRAARLTPEWNAKFISPNDDGRREKLKVTAGLSEQVAWTLLVSDSPLETGQTTAAESMVYAASGRSNDSVRATWQGANSEGTPMADAVYHWRLNVMDKAGNFSKPVAKRVVVDRTAPVVRALEIGPNPFYPKTDRRARVKVELTEGGMAKIRIRRRGRLDRVLNVTVRLDSAGMVRVTWDGKDEMGRPVAPGRYMVIIKAVDRAKNTIWNRSGRIRVLR
jgi:hypothetical protein